jgi:hypothetical protein
MGSLPKLCWPVKPNAYLKPTIEIERNGASRGSAFRGKADRSQTHAKLRTPIRSTGRPWIRAEVKSIPPVRGPRGRSRVPGHLARPGKSSRTWTTWPLSSSPAIWSSRSAIRPCIWPEPWECRASASSLRDPHGDTALPGIGWPGTTRVHGVGSRGMSRGFRARKSQTEGEKMLISELLPNTERATA